MGLFFLKETCWKNLLLLSTAAVYSCICVLQTQFIQVIGCLTPLSPHPFFLYLADPILGCPIWSVPEGSHCWYIVFWSDRWEKAKGLSATMPFGSCHTPCVLIPLVCWYVPICAGTFWYTATKLCDHLGWWLSGFILCNNLITIWYSNGAHCSNLLRCFAWLLWCFLYCC